VRRALKIIEHVDPTFWTIENPHAELRKRPCMLPLKSFEHVTSYCHFGTPYRKDTNIWTNAPVVLPVCRHGSQCRRKRETGRHGVWIGTTNWRHGTNDMCAGRAPSDSACVRVTTPRHVAGIPARLTSCVVATALASLH
jgi:hypothetical protein